LYKYSDKWAKIGIHVGIGLGNNKKKLKLHRFTKSKNIAKSSDGYFLTHTVDHY